MLGEFAQNPLKRLTSVILQVRVEYDGVLAAQSGPRTITLVQRASPFNLTRAGMLTILPSSPRFRGELLTLRTIAHTGGQALSTFGVRTTPASKFAFMSDTCGFMLYAGFGCLRFGGG